MSRVVIILTDEGEGVKCTAEPTFEQMARAINCGVGVSAAEGYALAALKAIRDESKKMGEIKVKLPRVLRP